MLGPLSSCNAACINVKLPAYLYPTFGCSTVCQVQQIVVHAIGMGTAVPVVLVGRRLVHFGSPTREDLQLRRATGGNLKKVVYMVVVGGDDVRRREGWQHVHSRERERQPTQAIIIIRQNDGRVTALNYGIGVLHSTASSLRVIAKILGGSGT